MRSRVLLIGLRSDAVDFDRWPHLTRESLESAFEEVRSGLDASGHASRWCLIDPGATARDEVQQALGAFEPDIVSIGAGVRADPEHLRLFEDLVNLVHELAPGARFAFNTDPLDTIRSVDRAATRADDGAADS